MKLNDTQLAADFDVNNACPCTDGWLICPTQAALDAADDETVAAAHRQIDWYSATIAESRAKNISLVPGQLWFLEGIEKFKASQTPAKPAEPASAWDLLKNFIQSA